MKFSFITALSIGVLNACASPAQNTGPVDPFIGRCIEEGFSHQVCACTAINMRAEIGEETYGELLSVLARMAVLEATGLDKPDPSPVPELTEYQVLEVWLDRLMSRGHTDGLAYRANRELCVAQSQN